MPVEQPVMSTAFDFPVDMAPSLANVGEWIADLEEAR
jgi:hypothetical protein